jgi:hypothetical protein
MYEQFFRLEGWQNKLSLIWKGPSWQPGLPRLGNHQYSEIKYPIKFHHPNIPIALSIYTFAHFLYVLVQYSAVLRDSKVKSAFIILLFHFVLSEPFGNGTAYLFTYFTVHSNNIGRYF